MSNNKKLHSDFDLLYDLKQMDEVERIARGESTHSDASPEDLVDLFTELRIEVPECLKSVTGTTIIWVLDDGTWLSEEPNKLSKDKYQKVKINKF